MKILTIHILHGDAKTLCGTFYHKASLMEVLVIHSFEVLSGTIDFVKSLEITLISDNVMQVQCFNAHFSLAHFLHFMYRVRAIHLKVLPMGG